MLGEATAVILHWNQPEVCLRTIDRFLADPAVRDVIVVDNGSRDDARDLVGRKVAESPGAEFVDVGHNSGFGPGINVGWERWLAERSTTWCVIAPHDATPAEGTISALLDAGQVHDLGLVSADVGDGLRHVVDHVFGPIGHPLDPQTQTGQVVPVDFPHGTLMAVSRRCLETVGLFDRRYFAYCEEADLALRARRSGFPTALVVGARVENPHVGTPAPVVDYLRERNTILLMQEHFGTRKALMRFGITVGQLVRGLAQRSSRGPYWSTEARMFAIRDVVLRRWGAPPASLLSDAR